MLFSSKSAVSTGESRANGNWDLMVASVDLIGASKRRRKQSYRKLKSNAA